MSTRQKVKPQGRPPDGPEKYEKRITFRCTLRCFQWLEREASKRSRPGSKVTSSLVARSILEPLAEGFRS